ncbi:paired amphipathic helix protein Sin3b [Nematocida sp. AWRm77]|nr:paired amphipathic helix protein Sin3b [Nematocida sp. AWRm77]
MEDQKKTDVIKNIRTVLPSLNLKSGEKGEQSVPPVHSAGPSAPPSTAPKQMKAPSIAPSLPAPAAQPVPPPGMPPMGGAPSMQGKPIYGHRPPDRSINMAPGRYRIHTSTAYSPYSVGGKPPSMAYPPGRHSPHTQTRYYPPMRQYPYGGEASPQMPDPSLRMPPKKMPPPHPVQHHVPPPILVPEVGGSAKVQIKDAMRYLDIVRAEYQNNTEVYNRFLKTMKDYKERHIDAKGVIEIILVLFNGNQKLLQGFNQFLPKKYEILPSGEVKMHEDKDRDRERSREKRSYSERPMPPHVHERGDKERFARGPEGMHGGHFPHARDVNMREKDPRDLREHEYEHKIPRHETRDPRHDLEGLGIGIKPAKMEGDDTGRVIGYLNKVRKHLENNPVAWFEFLRIVQACKNKKEHRPLSETIASIKHLLKDDPALIDEFMVFLPAPGIHETSRLRALHRTHPADSMSMLNDIKSLLVKKGVYREFVKALNMFNQGLLSTSSLLLVIEPFLRHSPALFSLFRYYIGHREPDAPPHMQSSLETYTKVGSYRILPEKYRHSMHTGQTPEDASVLNIDLMSCPTFSSESSTFIFAKKNIHEEVLFRVEDERYEADLLIERISSLIIKLIEHEENAVEEANLPKEHADVAFPKLCLSAIDKEVLSVVYGSSTDDIILGLIAHPIRAVPVVLKQLRTTEGQWVRARAASVEMWRVAIDKNYIKALDVKGYKVRNGERKTSLVKQFSKDLDSAQTVEFSFLDRTICQRVIDLLQNSLDPEEDDITSKYLSLLGRQIFSEGVFVCTPEIYCALRGIASISSKLYDAVKGKQTKPKTNPIASDLGLQEPSKTATGKQIFALVSEYVVGEMETAKFEEQIMEYLGVAGTALIGISGAVQNVEAMLEAVGSSKASVDIIERMGYKEDAQKECITELLLKGVSLVKITIKHVNTFSMATAQKLSLQPCLSAQWTDYVKQYSTEPTNGRPPYLQRTVKSQKRKMAVSYGLESFFAEYKFNIKHIPGTEDFVIKKKKAL